MSVTVATEPMWPDPPKPADADARGMILLRVEDVATGRWARAWWEPAGLLFAPDPPATDTPEDSP